MNELIHIFRECLVALLPPLTAAKIWPACYDDWDDIVETLWKNVVIRTIESAVPPEAKDDLSQEEGFLNVPRYGLAYDKYAEMSFVEVVHPSLGVNIHPFYSFNGIGDRPFAKALYCSLDSAGSVVQRDSLPASDVTYRFRLRVKSGELQPLDALLVHL